MEISLRNRRGISLALGLALLMVASPASAQNNAQSVEAASTAAPSTENDEDIVVIGETGKRYTLSSDRLKSAVRVFNKFRPNLAPQASLQFKVAPREGKQLKSPEFWLERKDERIDLPLDAGMRFSVPQDRILQSGWKLRSNQARSLTVSPVIMSPGSTKDNRRFGDMRLQCRVMWELMPEVSGPLRIMGDAIGVCSSNKVAMIHKAEKPISAVRVTDNGKPDIDLPIESDGQSFRVPFHDKKIANEARFRLTYR